MRQRLTIALTLWAFLSADRVLAQDNNPVVIPERLQELAAENKVAERLKINWNEDVKADDVSKYLGLLAAVNEVAITIAVANKRKEPGDNDYLAALSAFCLFPPNKPPVAEKYWDVTISAFYDTSVRAALDKAVGKLAYDLPDLVQKYSGDPESYIALFPTDENAYLSKVINFKEIAREQ